MKETKIQVTQRKIRNGLRKQSEKIQTEKEKVWDRLKETPKDRKRRPMPRWTIDGQVELESYCSLDLSKEIADSLIAEITAKDIDKWKKK